MNNVDLSNRTRCPFYGVSLFIGAFTVDDDGGRSGGCALEDGHSPCMMHFAGEQPDFTKCNYNCDRNTDVLEKMREYMIRLREVDSNVKFGAWYDMIMDENREDIFELEKIGTLP